jgi:hypothetical protein
MPALPKSVQDQSPGAECVVPCQDSGTGNMLVDVTMAIFLVWSVLASHHPISPISSKSKQVPPLQAIAGLLSHRRPNPVLHRTQCCTRPKPMPRHTFAPSAPYFCPHYNTLLSTPLGTYHWLLPWRRTATLRLLPRVRLLLPVLSHVLLPNLYLMLWIIYHRCI